MIGLLRGWTHFRPLSATRAGYYAPSFLLSIENSPISEVFKHSGDRPREVPVRLLSAPWEARNSGLRVKKLPVIGGGKAMMYICAPCFCLSFPV